MISRYEFRNIIIVLTALLLISYGCNDIKNKEYIAEKVEDLYRDVSSDPFSEISNMMNDAVESGDVHSALQDQQNAKLKFHAKCVETINNDPILKSYFESFCERTSTKEKLTIETLNYRGFPIRRALENELDIDIVD